MLTTKFAVKIIKRYFTIRNTIQNTLKAKIAKNVPKSVKMYLIIIIMIIFYFGIQTVYRTVKETQRAGGSEV